MIETQRLIVFDQKNESGAVRVALAQTTQLARNHGNTARILVPVKEQYSTLGQAIGSVAMTRLLAGGSVLLGGNVNIALESIRTFNRFSRHVVLVLYPGKKMLDLIDDSTTPAVVVVPMVMEDIESWRRSWNPVIVGEAAHEAETLIGSPLVEEAMRALTVGVNLKSGLTHPRDKASAVDLLRKLKSAGETFNPDDLRTWAIRHGWTPRGADQLQEAAGAILAGRVVRTSAPTTWRNDIIDVLRERVGSKS